jgi:hypothetical protein
VPRRRARAASNSRIGGPAATNLKRAAVDKFFTVREVTDLLVVCDRTVRRWTGKKLVWHKFGGLTRIAQYDLRTLIVHARRAGTPLGDPTEDKFYTAAEVAGILAVCMRTIRRRIQANALIAYDFDGIIRIAESDLRDFYGRSRRE